MNASQSRLLALLPLIVMISALRCHPTPQDRYRQRLTDTGPPALHAVHSKRMQEIMRELQRLALERLPQEMDRETERVGRLRDISEIASALAADADAIPAALDGVLISPEHRAVFNSYAAKLNQDARTIGQAAERGQVEAIEAGLDAMVTTCNACHDSFRILPRATPAEE